jgi:hypothetical protein
VSGNTQLGTPVTAAGLALRLLSSGTTLALLISGSSFHRLVKRTAKLGHRLALTYLRGDIMKTSKYFLLAATLVLLAGLSFSAMAQSKRSVFRLPPEPLPPGVSVIAIEVTDGISGFDNKTKLETVFGYSFLGRTTGSMPGSFTISMNCTPATPIPGESSDLTGGSWTLPVYMTKLDGGGYAGSLYGTIAKGTMNWDKTGTNANIYIVLNVNGGTQTWDGVVGYATFTGLMFVDEKTQKTMLTGDLVFNIITISPDK